MDHIQEVVPLYTKALSLDPQVEDQTPPLLYAEACLRAARALHAVWTVGSWALKAVEFMVHPLATRPTLPDLTIPQRTSSSLIQRFSIADYVSRSITMHSITLPLFERLGLVSAAASLYSSIAYDRKRSSLLREAVALCSEAIMQAKKNNARQVAATSSLVKALPQADGNSSIMHLLRTVCVDVGIDLIQPYDPQTAKPIRPDHGEPEPFGWTELQVSVIKDAILSSRMLSDYPAALYFVASTLKSLSSPLGPEEQIKLRDDIPELSAAARRRGVEAPLDFWGPSNLIVSLELSKCVWSLFV